MLRGFLGLVEELGGGELPARELATAIEGAASPGRGLLAGAGAAVARALRAEGIVRDAPLARTWPCDGLGCARDVRELPGGPAPGRRRFLAVCSRDPVECEIEDLAEGDLAQVTVVLASLLASVQRALGIDPPRPGMAGGRASAAPGEPVALGEQIEAGVARDVFFVRRAGAAEVRALLAERASAARGTWLLIPTARSLAPELATRWAPGGKIAIEALTDLLAIDRDRLVPAVRLRAVPSIAPVSLAPELRPSPVPVAPVIARGQRARARASGPLGELLPRATRWNEVTFFSVEAHDKIGVEVGDRYAVFTAADLGLAEKSRQRRPVAVFRLLTTICDGNGQFVTKAFGGPEYGKRLMSDLRIALRAAFAIEADPFEGYSRRTACWKPKFRALAASPQAARDLEREIAWLAGEGDARPKRRRDPAT